VNYDAIVKSQKTSLFGIPAQAGIKYIRSVINCLAPCLRRGDDFLRLHQL